MRTCNVTSRRAERIKEARFFILASPAALARTISYAGTLNEEHVHSGATLFSKGGRGSTLLVPGTTDEIQLDEMKADLSFLSEDS